MISPYSIIFHNHDYHILMFINYLGGINLKELTNVG